MSDQKPREWILEFDDVAEVGVIRMFIKQGYDKLPHQEHVHVQEVTPKTLAAEEMYEALEDLRSFLISGDAPGGINAAQRIEHVLAKAGKR